MSKVLITGGSSGLGYELLLELIHRKFTVVNADQIPSKFTHSEKFDLLGNLTDNEFLYQLTKLIEQNDIDVLILNAASLVKNRFWALNAIEIEKQIELNLKVNLKLANTFLRQANHNTNKKPYTLIIISSSASFMPTPNMALYGATKSFLSSFAQNVMLEQKSNNIVVQCFEISGMKTNFQKANGVANPDSTFLISPKKVARKIVKRLVHGKSATYKIGVISYLISFIKRILPFNIYIKLIGFIFAKNR